MEALAVLTVFDCKSFSWQKFITKEQLFKFRRWIVKLL